MSPMPKKAIPQQSKQFIEKARELGCDEDEATFEARLKKIAKAAPPKAEPKRKSK
jgi:hypothetical protein